MTAHLAWALTFAAGPAAAESVGFDNDSWRGYRDGTTLGGFGILTTPRELAKLAPLVLQDGHWRGQSLVNPQWIREMTAPRVASQDERFRFGYQ